MPTHTKQAKYKVEGRKFIIENYNWARSQANFLPGIAGKYGIPMWVYYVSRNQAVCSMGINNKDQSLMEFLSFNKALDAVGRTGFRTFLKIGEQVYEPFRKTDAEGITQKMIISSEELELEEVNQNLGIQTTVTYFSVPNSNVPSFVRQLRIKNISSSDKNGGLVDGLPKIVAYGMDRHCTQVIARHIEGMIEAVDMEGLPLFRLKQAHADVEKIERIEGGNFYFSYSEGKNLLKGESYIVDPSLIFEDSEIFDRPWKLETNSIEQIKACRQIRFNKTPSAMSILPFQLTPNSELNLVSVLGYAKDDNTLKEFSHLFSDKNFVNDKRLLNTAIIEEIKNPAFMMSNAPELDEYIRQMMLDNTIRGGMPVPFETAGGKSAFYIYSRQNGDLERDYHEIVIEPSYFSQGTGHYRSVNQNRRMDCWFFPEIYDYNIFLFINLFQVDGYNPLEVTTISYRVDDIDSLKGELKSLKNSKNLNDLLAGLLEKNFTPGQLLMLLDENKVPRDEWESILKVVLRYCLENESGAVHEGFWVDHWHYNLDLIDNFLSVYPDRLNELLLQRKNYTYFDDPDVLLKREEKYSLVDGKKVRQYGAVVRDMSKKETIAQRKSDPFKMRTQGGKGEIYYTNLFEKLVCLAANRVAALDPECRGVEMEADKPGWNDSMNGLPGLIGSSLCEALELEKLFVFLQKALKELNLKDFRLFAELHEFVLNLIPLMKSRIQDGQKGNFTYWDMSRTTKEDYLQKTRYGINGEVKALTSEQLSSFFDSGLSLLSQIVDVAFDEGGVPYTYFENQVTKWEMVKQGTEQQMSRSGYPLVRAEEFHQRPLARFLEGPMHMLRIHPELKEKIYKAVKSSDLFDKKLKMYKVCESLQNEVFEIGRVKAWPSGWIENESVYTHMVYKYLLEILRSGLYKEFFEDIKTHYTCFLNPETYGRSTFENVSFIVSSAYGDESQHGRGFQARLSGVTSEVLHMWTFMTAGPTPFYLDGAGKLAFALRPALADWLFTKEKTSSTYYANDKAHEISVPENAFGFYFLGKVFVIYHNEKRLNTYEASISSYRLTYKNGRTESIDTPSLGEKHASDIRNGDVVQIEASIS